LSAADEIAALIERNGPVPFDVFMEHVLYGTDGFFTAGGGAGRAGRDFVTSPQIGALFGVLVGRALDREWDDLGQPDPFVVIEAGAGDGRLAREVLRAEPRCAPALRYVLVERSPALQAQQAERLPLVDPTQCFGPYEVGAFADDDDPLEPVAGTGPLFAQLDTMPARKVEGVVLANELLDNLPFAIAERTSGGWSEVRVALADEGFDEVAVPIADNDVDTFGVEVPVGARVPIPRALDGWFADAAAALRPGRGAVLAIDYLVPFAEVVARSPSWLRTYRGHERGGDALAEPGARDITADVPLEQAVRAAGRAGFAVRAIETQAEWLRGLGIDELVDEGERAWHERASVGDLDALAARSRRTEAAALTDPNGLGGFLVMRAIASRT
jgi:SAM-dependent MidA family methyltransferase